MQIAMGQESQSLKPESQYKQLSKTFITADVNTRGQRSFIDLTEHFFGAGTMEDLVS